MARHLAILLSAFRLMLARVVGAGAGFLSQVLLARLLPPEGLGLFFSFAALAGLIATQGYPGVMQRFVTQYRERRSKYLLRSFVWQVQADTLVITIAASLTVLIVGLLWPRLSFDNRLAFFGTALCTAAASSMILYGAFASVGRRFELAQLPETLIRPLAFLLLVLMVRVIEIGITAGAVATLYALLTAVLAFAQYVRIAPALPSGRKADDPRPVQRWRSEARLFALAIIFATSFADLAILLSSPLLGAAGLALFGVALKTSLLVGFAVQIAHQVALPDLSEVHERGDVPGIRRALWQAITFPSIVTGAALVAAAAGGEWFLGLFGAEYTAAKWPLVLLVVAQFLRAIAGPGQSILMLKGAQAPNPVVCVICTVTFAASNAVLIPLFGIYGAAIAVLITVTSWLGAAGYVLSSRNRMRVNLPFLLSPAGRV